MGIEKDTNLGMEWVHKAAIQNYPPALTYYGYYFALEEVNRPNLSKIDERIFEYLEKAIQQNYLPAKLFLAGLKVSSYLEKDKEKWINTLKELANQNKDPIVQSIAESTLAESYLRGYYVPENHEMALNLYKKSIQHRPMLKNMDLAMMTIALMYSNPLKYNEKEANLWINRSRQFDQEAYHCQKYIPNNLKTLVSVKESPLFPPLP